MASQSVPATLDEDFFDSVVAGGQDMLMEALTEAAIDISPDVPAAKPAAAVPAAAVPAADPATAAAAAAAADVPPVQKKRKRTKQPQQLQPQRNEAKEIDYLSSLDTEGLKAIFERSCFYLKELSVGTIITVHSHRVQEGGKWGPVPVIRGDFEGHIGADLALPQRFKDKFVGRELPCYMVYTGTALYQDKVMQKADFVDMVSLDRRLNCA